MFAASACELFRHIAGLRSTATVPSIFAEPGSRPAGAGRDLADRENERGSRVHLAAHDDLQIHDGGSHAGVASNTYEGAVTFPVIVISN